MPFYLTKNKQQPLNKKAIIATTPKKALDYNSILCYLLALCRKAFGKFFFKPNAAVKAVRWEEKKEKNILAEANGGVADANTRFVFRELYSNEEAIEGIYFINRRLA